MTTSVTWLELVQRGAGARELEQHRRDLLASTRDEARAGIEAEAARARDVAETICEHRRQSEEMTVLNELARSLGALRDPNTVLEEVASQAKRFLGVDVAYLMLLHGDVLRIEVSAGSVGSGLCGIELKRGVGIGGSILTTGMPQWSANYLQDASLEHAHTVDAAAAAEQLGGILGVPLMLGGETIGVLFAADRHLRVFSPHEVEMLAALAAHAAIAINNARQFDAAASAAEQLRSAHARLVRTTDIIERAVQLHDRLVHVMIRGGDALAVTRAVEQALDIRITVLDRDRNIVVGESPEDDVDLDLGRRIDDLCAGAEHDNDTDAEGLVSTVITETTGGSQALSPITLPEGFEGVLAARASRILTTEDGRLLETAATALALVLASERALAEAERRARGEVLSVVLAEHADPAIALRRARAAGLDLAAIEVIIVLSPVTGESQAASALASRVAHQFGGWTSEHAGDIVALLPDVTLAVTEQALSQALGEQPAPGAVCLAACDGGPSAVRDSYLACHQGARLLRALNRPRSVATLPELGIYRSLFHDAGSGDLVIFIDRTIGPLLNYDEQHRTELVKTLETYLLTSRHHARTCERLHVHANTLYARLERIATLLGADWKDEDRGLDQQLALRFHRLARTLGRQ